MSAPGGSDAETGSDPSDVDIELEPVIGVGDHDEVERSDESEDD